MSIHQYAKALTELLNTKGKSQTALAKELGVTPSTISNWSTAKNEPDPQQVFRTETALGVPPGTLSRHLGYLPVGESAGVLSAIDADSALAPNAKRALRMAFLSLAETAEDS